MKKYSMLVMDGKPYIDIYMADSFFGRLRGLLGTNELTAHTGLLLANCNSIHMFFMRYALDIVYLDAAFRIVKIVRNVRPWCISGCFQAKHTLELPVGTIDEWEWHVGDTLMLQQLK